MRGRGGGAPGAPTDLARAQGPEPPGSRASEPPRLCCRPVAAARTAPRARPRSSACTPHSALPRTPPCPGPPRAPSLPTSPSAPGRRADRAGAGVDGGAMWALLARERGGVGGCGEPGPNARRSGAPWGRGSGRYPLATLGFCSPQKDPQTRVWKSDPFIVLNKQLAMVCRSPRGPMGKGGPEPQRVSR